MKKLKKNLKNLEREPTYHMPKALKKNRKRKNNEKEDDDLDYMHKSKKKKKRNKKETYDIY